MHYLEGADSTSEPLAERLRRTLDRIDTPRMPEPLHHLECSSSKKDIGRLLSLLPPIAPSPCTRKAMPNRASDYEARRDRRNSRTRRPPPSLRTYPSVNLRFGRNNGERQVQMETFPMPAHHRARLYDQKRFGDHFGHNLRSVTQNTRSEWRKLGCLVPRFNTMTCCLKATISKPQVMTRPNEASQPSEQRQRQRKHGFVFISRGAPAPLICSPGHHSGDLQPTEGTEPRRNSGDALPVANAFRERR